MTNIQIRQIKIAQRQLKLSEADYRTILRSIGHVESCTDLSQPAFEDVMAFFEERGFRRNTTTSGDHYWRNVVAVRQNRTVASNREVWEIRRLLALAGMYAEPGMVLRVSSGATDDPARLNPTQASNLIEALKKICERHGIDHVNTPPAAVAADSAVGVQERLPF